MIGQTILPFKLSSTRDSITPHAGLTLFGEFALGLKLKPLSRRHLPGPGSAAGYAPETFLMPLLLMLNGGGRCLEDLRMISHDSSLRELLELSEMPSTDAVGDWLRRMGSGSGLQGLERMDRSFVFRALQSESTVAYTLDMDAMLIEAEKRSAQMTYKGFKGYSPLLCHLAENGLVLYSEFREGNVSPQTRNLEVLKRCVRLMPPGKRIKYFRSDSAAYQWELLDYCEEKGIKYAVGADLDISVREAIAQIPASGWRPIKGGHLAETVHSMNKSRHGFRLLVVKRPAQGHLFGEVEEHLTAIATNREEEAEAVLAWYNQRSDKSENRLKELKDGVGLEGLPCGDFAGNAAFFKIGVMAYNLFRIFELKALGPEWSSFRLRTVRWRFYNVAGKLVSHGGASWLKVSRAMLALFRAVRQRAWSFACG